MLKISNLTKSYKNKVILNGVDLKVKNNEIKALIGVNGAGKSTLIETVCGVKKKDCGEILINGLSLDEKRQRIGVKYAIGYMPQSFGLFNDLTVEENLKYLTAVYKINVDINAIMERCKLISYKNIIAKNLSGGYRQLLSLAGAIIHSPKLLILDEPSSAMDPLFRVDFWKIIKEYNKLGGTVLIITHHLEELLQCHSFACLSNGKITYDGKINEFKKEGFINIEEVLKKFS